MFIELSEFLRCPEPHPAVHCVILPERMVERMIVEGIVGCPACQREYPIHNGIVRFGSAPPREPVADLPDAEAVQALVGITSPGGNVVLAGSATRLAEDLVRSTEGVHLVGLNASPEMRSGPRLTLLESSASIPLRDAMARAVVLGSEYAKMPWTQEAARVALPGLRIVVLREDSEIAGLEKLVSGQGVWVGVKPRAMTRLSSHT